MQNKIKESPEYLRTSMAAAMTMGLKKGRFYRNAKLHCINLLLGYKDGCAGSCAYCGLSGKTNHNGSGNFIRVDWPVYELDEMTLKMREPGRKINRICISMITHGKAPDDTTAIIRRLKKHLDIPVSVLMAPMVSRVEHMVEWKNQGADKIGVAIDAATPELFDKYRGSGVSRKHDWGKYWDTFRSAIEIYGAGNASIHLVAGLGETEKEMAETIEKANEMGGKAHLFSFFPETGSQLEDRDATPMDQYRKIQLAKYILDNNAARTKNFTFDDKGLIIDFGLPRQTLMEIIDTGYPFMTSGCTGKNGEVACNRPYSNSPPGPLLKNYPFKPGQNDLILIRSQIKGLKLFTGV